MQRLFLLNKVKIMNKYRIASRELIFAAKVNFALYSKIHLRLIYSVRSGQGKLSGRIVIGSCIR